MRIGLTGVRLCRQSPSSQGKARNPVTPRSRCLRTASGTYQPSFLGSTLVDIGMTGWHHSGPHDAASPANQLPHWRQSLGIAPFGLCELSHAALEPRLLTASPIAQCVGFGTFEDHSQADQIEWRGWSKDPIFFLWFSIGV